MKNKKIYVFDIDGVICKSKNGDYSNSKPFVERINKINTLFNKGHKIILLTARNSYTGINWSRFTKWQMKKWGVKFHELHCNKPFGHCFIDDRGVSDKEFFDGKGTRKSK